MNYEKIITTQNNRKQYLKNIVLKKFFQRFRFYKKYFTKKYNNRITQITSQEVVFFIPNNLPTAHITEIVVNAASKLIKSFAGG